MNQESKVEPQMDTQRKTLTKVILKEGWGFIGVIQRDGIYRERILGGTKLILFSQLDQLLITPKRGPEYLFEKKLLPQFGQIWSH